MEQVRLRSKSQTQGSVVRNPGCSLLSERTSDSALSLFRALSIELSQIAQSGLQLRERSRAGKLYLGIAFFAQLLRGRTRGLASFAQLRILTMSINSNWREEADFSSGWISGPYSREYRQTPPAYAYVCQL